MTGIHGIHVLIGVIAIAIMFVYTRRGVIDRDNSQSSKIPASIGTL